MALRPARARAARALAIAALLALAFLVAANERRLDAEQTTLVAAARAAGTLERQPQLERALRREIDPERSRLLLAQALLSDELDRRWTGGLSPLARAAAATSGLVRLEHAAALGRTVLARRPAVWRAAVGPGAAPFPPPGPRPRA